MNAAAAARFALPSAAAAASPAPRPIRVMIVDDSAVARAVLGRMISSEPDLEVVGEAAGARQALDMLRGASVDIITLDVEMPGTDGVSALPQLLEAGRGARVIIVSSLAEDGAAVAMAALAAGAADTVPKPGGGRPHGQFSSSLLAKLRALGHAGRDGERSPPPGADLRLEGVRLRPAPRHPIACLAIGASTGGPQALARLFEQMDEPIGAPILLTQHLPAVFIPFFARQLATISGRETAVAADGAELVSDRILIAPGDGHLRLRRAGRRVLVQIDRRGSIGGCLPAIDPMLAAAAEHYGQSACGVILTGMGRDGSDGCARLAHAGAAVFVQDAGSSVVWGMPRSVAEAGHACAALEPEAIGRLIASRARATDARRAAASWT